MATYITLDDLKSELDIQESTDNAVLQRCIDSAQSVIDNNVNRVFEAETATKYYSRESRDPEDSSIIRFKDDLLTITTLSNGDASSTSIAASSYWLLDRNDGPPYHGIQLTHASGVVWEWDTDGWVTIAGTWGWSATAPNDIRRAMLRMSAYFYRQRDSQVFDVTAIPEAGVITIPKGFETTMERIIERYKRYF